MHIIDREDKQFTLASWFAPLLDMGYGFTFGLVGNAIALLLSLFWFVPGHWDFGFFWAILDLIAFFGLVIIQLIGFVHCLVDLSSKSTWQSRIKIVFAAVGLVLNCLPIAVFSLITGTQGNGIL